MTIRFSTRTRRALGALVLGAAMPAAGLIPGPAVAATDPPYARLARDLGTPELVQSAGPRDKSQLVLHFARPGESYGKWTKMTTISIVKVDPGDTTTAARSIVAKFRAALTARKASVATFDENVVPPINAFFAFSARGENDQGIAYSPSPGFVSVIQVAQKQGAPSPADARILKKVAGR